MCWLRALLKRWSSRSVVSLVEKQRGGRPKQEGWKFTWKKHRGAYEKVEANLTGKNQRERRQGRLCRSAQENRTRAGGVSYKAKKGALGRAGE
eukprot:4294607-Pleurochrysis_carterae.AAC.2